MLSSWLLYIAIPLILGLWAQARVSSAFRRYSQVPASSGLSGAETAREILTAAQIHDVEVVQIDSLLGDHYNPATKRLALSNAVYSSASIAAVGIAAHETGHAIQHARGYVPMQLRMAVVPVTQFASQALPFIILGGFWFGFFGLLKIGVICYLILAFFQLITLPVEFDASARAKVILGQLGIVRSGEEAAGVSSVLDAAALTYVAAFIAALGNLLWLLSLTNRRR